MEGGCFCGKVRYKINGEVLAMYYCHCSKCRKLTGSTFATLGWVEKDKLEFITPKSKLSVLEGKSSSHFCSSCGSQIYSSHDDFEFIKLHCGTLDSDPGVKVENQYFLGSKAPWHDADTSIKSYEEGLD